MLRVCFLTDVFTALCNAFWDMRAVIVKVEVHALVDSADRATPLSVGSMVSNMSPSTKGSTKRQRREPASPRIMDVLGPLWARRKLKATKDRICCKGFGLRDFRLGVVNPMLINHHLTASKNGVVVTKVPTGPCSSCWGSFPARHWNVK